MESSQKSMSSERSRLLDLPDELLMNVCRRTFLGIQNQLPYDNEPLNFSVTRVCHRIRGISKDLIVNEIKWVKVVFDNGSPGNTLHPLHNYRDCPLLPRDVSIAQTLEVVSYWERAARNDPREDIYWIVPFLLHDIEHLLAQIAARCRGITFWAGGSSLNSLLRENTLERNIFSHRQKFHLHRRSPSPGFICQYLRDSISNMDTINAGSESRKDKYAAMLKLSIGAVSGASNLGFTDDIRRLERCRGRRSTREFLYFYHHHLLIRVQCLISIILAGPSEATRQSIANGWEEKFDLCLPTFAAHPIMTKYELSLYYILAAEVYIALFLNKHHLELLSRDEQPLCTQDYRLLSKAEIKLIYALQIQDSSYPRRLLRAVQARIAQTKTCESRLTINVLHMDMKVTQTPGVLHTWIGEPELLEKWSSIRFMSQGYSVRLKGFWPRFSYRDPIDVANLERIFSNRLTPLDDLLKLIAPASSYLIRNEHLDLAEVMKPYEIRVIRQAGGYATILGADKGYSSVYELPPCIDWVDSAEMELKGICNRFGDTDAQAYTWRMIFSQGVTQNILYPTSSRVKKT